MNKKMFFAMLFSFIVLSYSLTAQADDSEEWTKYLDVYTSDGLDKPVSAIEYKKTMDKLHSNLLSWKIEY